MGASSGGHGRRVPAARRTRCGLTLTLAQFEYLAAAHPPGINRSSPSQPVTPNATNVGALFSPVAEAACRKKFVKSMKYGFECVAKSALILAACGKLPHTLRMAKNVRISDGLYGLAQLESRLQDRSIAQQLEHWVKRGIAADSAIQGGASALDAAVAMTRKLDALDVLTGRRSADALHFIPRSVARRSKPVFPDKYQKS